MATLRLPNLSGSVLPKTSMTCDSIASHRKRKRAALIPCYTLAWNVFHLVALVIHDALAFDRPVGDEKGLALRRALIQQVVTFREVEAIHVPRYLGQRFLGAGMEHRALPEEAHGLVEVFLVGNAHRFCCTHSNQPSRCCLDKKTCSSPEPNSIAPAPSWAGAAPGVGAAPHTRCCAVSRARASASAPHYTHCLALPAA